MFQKLVICGFCFTLGVSSASVASGLEAEDRLSQGTLDRVNAKHYMHEAQRTLSALEELQRSDSFGSQLKDLFEIDRDRGYKTWRLHDLVEETLQDSDTEFCFDTRLGAAASVLSVWMRDPDITATTLLSQAQSDIQTEIDRYAALIPSNNAQE